MRILTDREVVRTFGDPTPFIRTDGSVSTRWEEKIIARFKLPEPLLLTGGGGMLVTRVSCHKLVAPFLSEALTEIHAAGLWDTINDWGGCYNWRTQRKAKARSRHSWGIAVDMDVADNAQGDTTPGIEPAVVSIMEAHGFYWGGRFKGARIDAMHHEPSDEMLARF